MEARATPFTQKVALSGVVAFPDDTHAVAPLGRRGSPGLSTRFPKCRAQGASVAKFKKVRVFVKTSPAEGPRRFHQKHGLCLFSFSRSLGSSASLRSLGSFGSVMKFRVLRVFKSLKTSGS